ncbi:MULTISPECIES: DUF1641 domain-containing protein [Haloferax]|uniref:DUF1641 domain-containing protein n=2 Tax=Haloferax TaxID=2251 RepID=A0A6G1Z5H5_9EURY|nr:MULTISPECIES: DUF1641 domain-containing protein [Haloferax]KAB1189061.1 DUF1641 domain-containing protein [Haloferax sp. CBA1149]MRW81792.1 DUF1641 domain-containing protein [Haloferax marinisediminis]
MSDSTTETTEKEREETTATDEETATESETTATDEETAAESETTTEAREALEAAIAEHPDEVVAFVERLGLLNELFDTTQLATSALDDEMVVRLSGTSSLLLESADGLATRETASLAASVGENAEDLEGALKTLVRLEQTGTLDELAQVADAATLLTSAMDDEMVMKLAKTGSSLGEVVDTASDPDTVRALQTLMRGMGEAGSEPPKRTGTIGMVRQLRDPEVQRGMNFLLALARGIGSDLDRLDEPRD